MTLSLYWRIPERRVTLRWRGPAGMAESVSRDPAPPAAAVIGPPGPPGPAGPGSTPLRLDASLAATWVLLHPLGRVPTVQVFLPSGEAVLADIQADETRITATFPSPHQGFVLAF